MDKFRVWDGEEMHLPPHHYVKGGGGQLYRKDYLLDDHIRDQSIRALKPVECEDMGYTGLDDAEAAPIYQADVLEWHSEEGEYVQPTDWIVGHNGGLMQVTGTPFWYHPRKHKPIIRNPDRKQPTPDGRP